MKDHQFGVPIVDLKYHEASRNVISSCKKITRIWNVEDGKLFTSIEPNVNINDVCVQEGYGALRFIFYASIDLIFLLYLRNYVYCL